MFGAMKGAASIVRRLSKNDKIVPLIGRFGENIDPTTVLVEFDVAVDQGENRVIAPESDTLTGAEFRADLPNDDAAGPSRLPAKKLDAATLPIGIATVSTGTLTFFMCHKPHLFGISWVGSILFRVSINRSKEKIKPDQAGEPREGKSQDGTTNGKF